MPILMRDRACRIDASRATESTATTTSSLLGGPIGPVGPIDAVESNGSPQSRMEEFSNTTVAGMPVGVVGYCYYCSS